MNAIFEIDLIVGGYSFRLTDDLKNWDDVKYSFKRDDFGGVVRSFSTKFEFAGKARQLLKSEYDKNYLFSSASVSLYTTNNSRLLSEKFRCALDFSTMDDDGNTISINAIDDTLASIIKAKKGVQYDIPVADVKEEKSLYYDRLLMRNTYNFYIDNDEYVYPTGSTIASGNIDIYVVDNNNEVYVDGYLEPYHEADGAYSGNTKGIFMKILALPTKGMYMDLSFDVSVSSGNASFQAEYARKGGGEDYGGLIDGASTSGIHAGEVYHFDKKGLVLVDPLKNEHHKVGVICRLYFNASAGVKIKIENFKMSVYYMDRMNPELIDVISPVNLLNSILKSINGNKEGITGEIASGIDCRLDKSLIVPAESVKGITQSKIHTSYTKFCDWMSSVFGFVPVISSSKVTFIHRNSLYSSKAGKRFGTNFNNFKLTVDPSLIYSSVKVGYEKKDYESVNGRDEFRFTNEFTTGITISDKMMTLMSPYRADAYGIEFLAQKRGEDTTDNSSDNDVFFVCAELKNERYELVRNVPISGVISPSTMFNVMYSPKSMIKANEKFIGVFAGELVFASSEGNSDVSIDGVSEKANIQIPERLFRAEKISIESPDIQMPESMDEIITFEKDGKIHQCYLTGVDYNVGRPESAKYNLIAKSHEDS